MLGTSNTQLCLLATVLEVAWNLQKEYLHLPCVLLQGYLVIDSVFAFLKSPCILEFHAISHFTTKSAFYSRFFSQFNPFYSWHTRIVVNFPITSRAVRKKAFLKVCYLNLLSLKNHQITMTISEVISISFLRSCLNAWMLFRDRSHLKYMQPLIADDFPTTKSIF